MKSKKLYLPLSMVLVLVCSGQNAQANSVLDPYAHVKAPEPVREKNSVSIPSVDEVTAPQSYVTMPMGTDNQDKSGLVETMMMPITGTGKMLKKAGSSSMSLFPKSAGNTLAKGGKAIGDGFAKSASVIGSGIKASGEKLMDGTQSVGSKIANAMPNKKATPRQRTINDIYIERTQQELAKVDGKAASQDLAQVKKDSKDNVNSQRTTFLKLANRGKVKKNDNPAPESGFFQAMTDKEQQQKQEAALRNLPKQPGQEKEQIASAPENKEKEKKGFGLKFPKLNKPTIGAGLFKKKSPEQKPEIAKETTQPAPEENKVATQTSTSTPMEIPGTPAKEAVPETNKTQVAELAPKAEKVEKKGRFGMPKLSVPKIKLNPFAKDSKEKTLKDLQL